MIKRVTKKHIEELTNIIINQGYWSEEVKEYLSQFTYDAMNRLNDKAKANIKNINKSIDTEVIEEETNNNIIKTVSACKMVNYNTNKKIVAIDNKHNVYICNVNEYDNNDNMKNAIKVSENKNIFYLLIYNYSIEVMQELFSNEEIEELKIILKQYNLYHEKFTINKEETISNGTEFITIDNGEYKKVTIDGVIDIKGVKWYTIKESNNIYKLDYIKEQLLNNKILSEKLDKQIINKKKLESEKIKNLDEKQKAIKEYNRDNGFTSDKSPIEKGKILKQLNSTMIYNNEFTTSKKVIELIISEAGAFTKSFLNTNRYSKKKVDGEYKKLSDKIEYRLYINNNTFINLNKTLFSYANYLIALKEIE